MTEKQPPKDLKNNASKDDRDAIDRLSLSNIPLSSQTLKSAKLVKNVRMESAIELHSDPLSGSLQIRPEDIPQSFATATVQDQRIIAALSALNSYDVYSLRSSLKKLGIAVHENELELSKEMKAELAARVAFYTRPMLERIFGNGAAVDYNDSEAFTKLLRDPDVNRVRDNLKIITQKTGIPMDEIPAFVESYSDVLMSVAYYHYSFESVQKELARFQEWIKLSMANKKDTSVSPQAWARCKKSADILRFLAISLKERMQILDKNFENFWGNINQKSFENLRAVIEGSHTSLGANICTLLVKIRAWGEVFPDNDVGGPIKRSTFVITDMEPGLERLMMIENDARKKNGLTPLG